MGCAVKFSIEEKLFSSANLMIRRIDDKFNMTRLNFTLFYTVKYRKVSHLRFKEI